LRYNLQRSGKPFDVDGFLQRPLMAHLATASAFGPRESPVWFLWEDEAIWLIGNSRDSFRRYLGDDRKAWDPWFTANVVDGIDLMLRFAPETVIANDQSYFKSDARRLDR